MPTPHFLSVCHYFFIRGSSSDGKCHDGHGPEFGGDFIPERIKSALAMGSAGRGGGTNRKSSAQLLPGFLCKSANLAYGHFFSIPVVGSEIYKLSTWWGNVSKELYAAMQSNCI